MDDDTNDDPKVKINYAKYMAHIRYLNNHYAGQGNVRRSGMIKAAMGSTNKLDRQLRGKHLLDSNLTAERQLEEAKTIDEYKRVNRIKEENE